MLAARINEKRAELENLKQLRDLSAGLATQMQTLEEKLLMLSDGTEGFHNCQPLVHPNASPFNAAATNRCNTGCSCRYCFIKLAQCLTSN